jgi:hypothetical protein
MVLKENEERTAKEKYEKKVLDDAERRRKNQENMSDVSHNYCYMYESPCLMLLLGLTFVSGIAFGYGLTKYLAQFLSKQKNIEKHNRSVVKIWPNCCGSTVILGEFSCFSYQSFLIFFF